MRATRLRFLPILSTVLLAASFACSSSSPPTCEAAVRHIAQLRGALDVPENVAKCLREKWTSTARACIVRAGSTKDVTGCMTGRENPDQRPAAGETGGILAAPLGGDAPRAPSGGDAPAAARAPSGGGPFGSVDEARLNLNSIEQANVREFAENSQFVVGAVGLTPSAPCCSFPGHRCPVEVGDWQGVPAWDALDFEMTKPFAFRYSYQSDGQTYEARAVGDLDCDGTTITYVVRGRVTDAGPVSELVEPKNAD